MTEAAVSIIIPVLHEAETINALIAHLRSLDAGQAREIIVVDGDPEGSTIKAVQDAGVRLLISGRGRARQMNRGGAAARGDVLLFLHADTFLPANAAGLILSCLEDRRVVAGAFELGFLTERRIFRITERYVSLRTRLTRIPFGDQAVFIRRDYFEAIGGFREIPLMEDVELMKRIRTQGGRIAILPAKALTSARRYEREGIVFCTLRNWSLQFLYMLGVAPERLAKWYRQGP